MLDNKLKALNSDYEAKRYNDLVLKKPKVTVVKKGIFYQWMRYRGKLGGQNKVPRLSNKRNHIDSMLQMLAEISI